MDLQVAFNGQIMSGDLVQIEAALGEDQGLTTAIIVSLFTDRRALPDDRLPEGEADRRGFWGDDVQPEQAAQGEGWRMGSRLWLLSREKQTAETARRAAGYAREALAWMVTDGVAKAVDVTAEWVRQGTLGLSIVVTRPDGTPQRYDQLWSQT